MSNKKPTVIKQWRDLPKVYGGITATIIGTELYGEHLIVLPLPAITGRAGRALRNTGLAGTARGKLLIGAYDETRDGDGDGFAALRKFVEKRRSIPTNPRLRALNDMFCEVVAYAYMQAPSSKWEPAIRLAAAIHIEMASYAAQLKLEVTKA